MLFRGASVQDFKRSIYQYYVFQISWTDIWKCASANAQYVEVEVARLVARLNPVMISGVAVLRKVDKASPTNKF